MPDVNPETFQPHDVGEQPASHRENTWTLWRVLLGNSHGQWNVAEPRERLLTPVAGGQIETREVVSSERRERAERAEAGRDEARALALELGAAVFVCPEHGVDGQPRCPVCAALARVRALADNESRNDG
jgi:hypothetical protein